MVDMYREIIEQHTQEGARHTAWDGGCCTQHRRLIDGQKRAPQHQLKLVSTLASSYKLQKPQPAANAAPPQTNNKKATICFCCSGCLVLRPKVRRPIPAQCLSLPARPLPRALPGWCSLPLDRFHLPVRGGRGAHGACMSVARCCVLADSVVAHFGPLMLWCGCHRSTRWTRGPR